MSITRIAEHARGFIMTMATIEDLIAARSSNFASSSIVLASESHLPKIKALIDWAFHWGSEEE
jgi:hypothetical protein